MRPHFSDFDFLQESLLTLAKMKFTSRFSSIVRKSVKICISEFGLYLPKGARCYTLCTKKENRRSADIYLQIQKTAKVLGKLIFYLAFVSSQS